MESMINNHWSGNVRELIHRIERAVIISTGQYLDEIDLGLTSPKLKKGKTLKELRNEFEKDCIIQSLISNRWNITHTAKKMGVTRETLRSLIKKHKIVKSG